MHRVHRVGAHLLAASPTAAAAAGPQTPPWDLPPPKDTPPQLDILSDKVKDGRIPVRTTISSDFQREFLVRSGCVEKDFLGSLDPSFVSAMLNAIMTQKLWQPPKQGGGAPGPKAGSFGSAHVSDKLHLKRPLKTGEQLTISLGVGVDSAHPKGKLTATPVQVTDASGAVVLDIDRVGLELQPMDPSKAGAGSSQKAPPADPKVGKSFVSATQFTPDMVAGYCYYVTNRIHNEVETAQAFGYKLPIWAGTQGMHLTMKHLYSFGMPQTMTAEFSFIRPVFWTDRLELWVSSDLQAKKGVGEYVLLNPEGKVTMSMVVEAVTF